MGSWLDVLSRNVGVSSPNMNCGDQKIPNKGLEDGNIDTLKFTRLE